MPSVKRSSAQGPPRQWRAIGRTPSAERTDEFGHDFTRRGFLQALSLPALAALAGCDGPPPDAVPYVRQPEDVIPGVARFYASAVMFDGYAQPVIAETHEGRPTKLEGNPDHPCSRGTTDAFTQAAVADLYNPERSAAPLFMGRPASWNDADAFLLSLHGELQATGGKGFCLLTGPTTSPTLLRQFQELLARYPAARRYVMDGVGDGLRPAALHHAFGDVYDLHLHPENADVIVSFDDDFLGPGPRQTVHALRWSDRRRQAAADGRPVLLYAVEATPSLTGVAATSRKAVGLDRCNALLNALAEEFGLLPHSTALEASEQHWIETHARELRQAGKRALVLAGAYLPIEAQVLAAAINQKLQSVGTTLQYTKSALPSVDRDSSLDALVRDIETGIVKTLCVIDANPVYGATGDIRVVEALRRIPQTLHLGLYDDETAAECQWHLPIAHTLESWGDGRAVDGTVTILQPLVRSFLDVRPVHDILHRIIEGVAGDPLAIVRATWSIQSTDTWRQILDRGYIENTRLPVVTPTLHAAAAAVPPEAREAYEILVRPDPTIWDGRNAANLWLQEIPKPLTKVTWENTILVAPSDAQALQVKNGDVVEVATINGRVSGPVWIQPGQAPNTLAVFLGYGRRRAGRTTSNIGYDAAPLRTAQAPWQTAGSLHRMDATHAIATTQLHSDMGAFDFVKVVARGESLPPPNATPPTLYPPRKRGAVAWGMVIDLDLCIGCNACAVACQAENNVPVVGKDQVRRGREMHWLRIDRYFEGPADNPAVHFQPVPCMHCEQAPCEMGCPVHATTHNSEGLNQMVYNRCIGTRTCSSYCPYKVRRFNWLDYTGNAPPGEQAQRNPNVTVRGRGIMEKCTYCVQRINAAEIRAQKQDRGLRDGDVRTACQAACPTQAIVFGNISDADSVVAEARESSRNYSLLEEQGTHPRTTYLAKVIDAPPEENGS